MKVICSKNELLKGVNIVLKAVPSKTTMPILECILISANEDGISLTANDMELGIETKVKGQVIEPGIIAINAKLFSEIVRKLPDNEIVINVEDNYKINILCENSNFSLIGKDGDDFSYLPYIEREKSIYMSQFTLKEVIRQTIFSIADNDSNKIMTGELFEVKGNKLKVVSLDGNRIAIRQIELKEEFDDTEVIVPGKTLSEISKIINGDTEDEIKIFFTKNHIVFEFDDTVVISRVIEGEYFKINKMLSSDYETKISINKRDILDCIDRATLLVREGDKKPIIISVNDTELELKINSYLGSMNENISITKEGRDIMIGFNPKFLMDALRVIDDETIDIYLINSKAPCFIRDEEEKYIYLILPVDFNVSR